METKAPPKGQITVYYDSHAAVYETKHGLNAAGQSYNFKHYYEPFLNQVLPPHGTVLELGCGTGFYTQWLLQRRLTVIGMDISTEMLALARERCPRTLFFEGDCEDPAAYLGGLVVGNGFEAIMGVNVFGYLPNKETAILNYRKLLARNGRLILLDMNGFCPYYQWMAWLNKNEMRQWLKQIKESRKSYLVSLFQRAGFQVDRLEHFAFIPNGVNSAVVNLMRPIDYLLQTIPFARPFAMRIALAATKKEAQ